MKCTDCGNESEGAYCAGCGAPAQGARCRRCDAVLPRGARYCTQCGTAVRRREHLLPWGIAAAAVLGLLLVLLRPSTTDDATAPGPAAAPAQQPTGAPGPLTGTPREQADRLFNRIMQEREAGDSARAAFFLPMALQAYDNAGELDADGHFHRGLLYLMAGDAAGARRDAERILAEAPDHVFGLAILAEAALLDGDTAAARRAFQRLDSRYDAETAQQREEYVDHRALLPQYRQRAQQFLASS